MDTHFYLMSCSEPAVHTGSDVADKYYITITWFLGDHLPLSLMSRLITLFSS